MIIRKVRIAVTLEGCTFQASVVPTTCYVGSWLNKYSPLIYLIACKYMYFTIKKFKNKFLLMQTYNQVGDLALQKKLLKIHPQLTIKRRELSPFDPSYFFEWRPHCTSQFILYRSLAFKENPFFKVTPL